MRRSMLCWLILGLLLLPLQSTAAAAPVPTHPWDGSVIPGSIPEGGSDWFFDLGEYLYENNSEQAFVLASGDVGLALFDSADVEYTGEQLYFYQPEDPLIGDPLNLDDTLLFIRTYEDSVELPGFYHNETAYSGAFEADFYDGALMTGDTDLDAETSGDVTFTVEVPAARGYYTVKTFSLGEQTWPEVAPWVDCQDDSLFNKVVVARVEDTPYYEVRYTNYGGALAYGFPAGTYPMVRRDLTPSRFITGDSDITIQLGTVFVDQFHGWLDYEQNWQGDGGGNDTGWPGYPEKGHSLMVKVTNWGSRTDILDIDPLSTGFEAFNLRHRKLDCDTDWPAWGWKDYLNDDPQENWDDFTWDGESQWPLPPAFSVMYWAGRFDNDPPDTVIPASIGAQDALALPENRVYSNDLNTFTVDVADATVTFRWTPKPFRTLMSLYPEEQEEADALVSEAWTADAYDEQSIDTDNLSEYQGSGMVVHQVAFDIPSADLGGLDPFYAELDMVSGDVEFDLVSDDPALGFDRFLGLVVAAPVSGDTAGEGEVAVLPLHMMLYLSKAAMMDLDSTAYSQFTDQLAGDTPLDVAFLNAFELLQAEAEGSSVITDIISAVEDAGQEPTNFLRVVGNSERVCVHFFAVVTDSDTSGVEVKDGYFLIHDGVKDNWFATAIAQTMAPVSSTGDGGGCSGLGAAPFLLLLGLPLLTLMRK